MKKLPVSLTRGETVFCWVWWALQLLAVPLVLVLLNALLPAPLSEAKLNFVFFFLNFAVLTVGMWKFCIASCRIGLQRPAYTLQSAFFGFGIYYIASFLLGLLIIRLYPDFANLNDQSIATLLHENYTLTTVGTVLLVPVAEELMYRGLLFGTLYRRSRFLAYAVSAVVFAAVHLAGYITVYDPLALALSFLQYLPAGLCLGWAYARSGSILAPILIHMTINQIGIFAMR